MPIYRIREYYTYYDEYEVDAESACEAQELGVTYMSRAYPVTGVEQIKKHAYSDHHLETMVMDEDGDVID